VLLSRAINHELQQMTITPRILRVALYARVSSEEQKHGHNIDSQLAELKYFADHNHWPVVGTYLDEAWSGALLARPALDRLRDDAAKKVFDAVLINDVDRLARDVTHLGVIKRDLERSGARVIFRKIPSEGGPTHNLLVNILGSFAEFERELISDRTRRGRRHKVETLQKFIGAIPPYGFRYIPAKRPDNEGKLLMNVEEAAVVRRIYGWVDEQGYSTRNVVDRLNREGAPTRKGGSLWQKSSVTRILRSRVYCGTWFYNKNYLTVPKRNVVQGHPDGRKTSIHLRPQDEWIPVKLPQTLRIISDEQWRRVQQQLDRNRCFSPRNSHHVYLLSGLVSCGGCGARFAGNPCHGRFYYRCINRCKGRPMISEGLLDAAVWNAMERALNNPEILARAVEQIRQPSVPMHDELKEAQDGLKAIEAEEARILEGYRLSVLTPAQLSNELKLLAARRKVLESPERTLPKSKLPVQKSVAEYCKEIRSRLSTLTIETRRRVLQLLLRDVVFDGEMVRISGVIPLRNAARIAGTETDSLGRNPTPEAVFAFTAPVLRNYEVARAASLANLAKANEAIRRRGDQQRAA
jgi:site-specific DNA recombinase